MNDTERCCIVATELKHLGYASLVEHTGGGIFCVFVSEERFGAGQRWIFGMANETWGGCREAASGDPIYETAFDTSVPSDTNDPEALRRAAQDIDHVLRNL